MRTTRKLGVLGALTLAAVVSVAAVAIAGSDSQGPVTQQMEAVLTPTKAQKSTKKDPTPGKIGVGVQITDSTPGQSAPPATRVDVIADKDIVINAKGLPTCQESEIVQLQAEAARQKCKDAYLGSTGPPILPESTETNSALAQCGTSGDPSSTIPAVVSAFNGPPQGKNPRLFLHTDATPPGAGTVIVQVLNGVWMNTAGAGPGERAKPKSKTLRVTVPPLAGGACAIKRFEATIAKKFKVKGEKQSYISQYCTDKVWNFDSLFVFNSDPSVNPTGVQSLSPTDEVACTGKK